MIAERTRDVCGTSYSNVPHQKRPKVSRLHLIAGRCGTFSISQRVGAHTNRHVYAGMREVQNVPQRPAFIGNILTFLSFRCGTLPMNVPQRSRKGPADSESAR